MQPTFKSNKFTVNTLQIKKQILMDGRSVTMALHGQSGGKMGIPFGLQNREWEPKVYAGNFSFSIIVFLRENNFRFPIFHPTSEPENSKSVDGWQEAFKLIFLTHTSIFIDT